MIKEIGLSVLSIGIALIFLLTILPPIKHYLREWNNYWDTKSLCEAQLYDNPQ